MKSLTRLVLALVVGSLITISGDAAPPGSAFTYQGRLDDGGAPASGSYDFRFRLYDAAVDGSQLGTTLTAENLTVLGGVFTATLDFGAAFDGSARWLELAVRPGASVGDFTVLSPRQPLTAAPFALYALTPAGPQGAAGPKGDTGAQGPAGAVGAAGPKGDKGDTGLTGVAGPQGSAGAKGDRGDTGLTGPQGLIGATGPAGATGAQGLTGAAGAAGPQGIQGVAGATGAAGPAGTKGDPGATGAAGAQGLPGPQGIQGLPGAVGATGAQGPIGLTGATGNTGATGSPGAAGPAGSKGVNWRGAWSVATAYVIGDAVAQGGASWFAKVANTGSAPTVGNPNWDLLADKGATGASGSTGATGVQGPIGPTGATGATGPQGLIGLTGATGLQGPQGIAGSTDAWGRLGTAGTTGVNFLGTTDNQPLNFKVNGQRGLRLEPTASDANHSSLVNIVGGSLVNFVDVGVYGATVGGGGAVLYFGVSSTNRVSADFGTVGGGLGNTSSGAGATVSGGNLNTSGGLGAFVGGGELNSSNGRDATVPGGLRNTAGGDYSLAAGRRSKANHAGAFVWGDSEDADFTSTAANQFLIRAAGFVGINKNNPATALDVNGTVTATGFSGGGAGLTGLNAASLTGTIADARLSANVSLFGAGIESSEITDGTIAAADVNVASFNTTFWRNAGNAGTTAGTHFLGTTDDQPVEFKVKGTRALRLEPTAIVDTVNVIGGSSRNSVAAGIVGATIGGGGTGDYSGVDDPYPNRVEADFSTVSGGAGHAIMLDADRASIGGGSGNRILRDAGGATIAGGLGNLIGTNSFASMIGGGQLNQLETGAYLTTIGGGFNNMVQNNAVYAVIGGGLQNKILSDSPYATIPGGRENHAAAYAFAAGRRAKANDTGAFVWADSTDADFESTGVNQFLIRASGGMGLNTTNLAGAALAVNGAVTATSDGTEAFEVRGNAAGYALWDRSTDAAGRWSMFANGGVLGFYSAAAGNTLMTLDSAGLNVSNVRLGWDGNGGIEVGPTSAAFAVPYIDFHNGVNAAQDFNVRLINEADEQLSIYRVNSGTPMMTLNSGGLTVNGTFVSTSDRNAKENFQPIDPAVVLAKVAALPVSRWNYREDKTSEHIGPMAQDFYTAFGVGPDDKHIATVDEGGVALAAIQGLNQKLEDKLAAQEAASHSKDIRIAALEQRLARLEGLLSTPIRQ